MHVGRGRKFVSGPLRLAHIQCSVYGRMVVRRVLNGSPFFPALWAQPGRQRPPGTEPLGAGPPFSGPAALWSLHVHTKGLIFYSVGAKKHYIVPSHLQRSSSWVNIRITRDRLTGEKSNFNTRAWGIHVSVKIPKTARRHLLIWDKGEWGKGAFDFKSDNGRFTGTWGSANAHFKDVFASVGNKGDLAARPCLAPSYSADFIQIRLRCIC